MGLLMRNPTMLVPIPLLIRGLLGSMGMASSGVPQAMRPLQLPMGNTIPMVRRLRHLWVSRAMVLHPMDKRLRRSMRKLLIRQLPLMVSRRPTVLHNSKSLRGFVVLLRHMGQPLRPNSPNSGHRCLMVDRILEP